MENLFNQTKNKEDDNERIFSVSNYIKIVDQGLKEFQAKIIGEISEVNIGPTGHVYFALKDEKDKSLIRCVIWNSKYNLYGIKLKEGMKIIISGAPSLHQQYGFKFIASTIELAGKGVLKKEYERLKKEMEKEGLFSIERKKSLPELPQKIGLITSERGAVIHDFLNNIGKYGFKIKFINSRVEGQEAVEDLVSAIDYFKNNPQIIDILVIIRGGGSLESLQAFNNETLVRKVANCPFPIIAGIGHDKDVPLVSLVADKAVSTPTAVASILNESWEKITNTIPLLEKDIIHRYQEMLKDFNYSLKELSDRVNENFNLIFQKFSELENKFQYLLANISYIIRKDKEKINEIEKSLIYSLQIMVKEVKSYLASSEKQIKIFNPIYQLKFGYSIVYSAGKVIKSIKDIKKGEKIDIQVSDGKIKSKVEDIIN